LPHPQISSTIKLYIGGGQKRYFEAKSGKFCGNSFKREEKNEAI